MSFYSKYARLLNSRQSRTVVLYGNVYDLFWNGSEYVTLLQFLIKKTASPSTIQAVYELNGPIRFTDEKTVKDAYIEYKSSKNLRDLLIAKGANPKDNLYNKLSDEFDALVRESHGNTAVGLQFLRQLCDASRKCCSQNLHIIIESADMLLPAGKDIASLNDKDRTRITIVQDWFSDPGFCYGNDTVTLISESQSLIHSRITNLPQILSVEVAAPRLDDRKQAIQYFAKDGLLRNETESWLTDDLASLTAGLSIHAIRQMIAGCLYAKEPLSTDILVSKIETYIQSQVGDDVIEFKKPQHTLKDVIGFSSLKKFLYEELIPRLRATGAESISGAAIGGPVGSGKTFIFEAVASELGIPVIVLKNLRSQWYGQTDVIFERLRRVLLALEKVLIFVDEADTQFGDVSEEGHSTERRLTGKIQSMMSDTTLKGRVSWLLMTARIHLLSPDIRRPGRVGDLIIPVLDPEGDDHKDFVNWMLRGLYEPSAEELDKIIALTRGYSSAGFASLRSNLKLHKDLTFYRICNIIDDQIPPNIGPTREYQTYQALDNCTRKSLIPPSYLKDGLIESKKNWQRQIQQLELEGVS